MESAEVSAALWTGWRTWHALLQKRAVKQRPQLRCLTPPHSHSVFEQCEQAQLAADMGAISEGLRVGWSG